MVSMLRRTRAWLCASCQADRDDRRRSCARCGGTVWVSPAPTDGAAEPV